MAAPLRSPAARRTGGRSAPSLDRPVRRLGHDPVATVDLRERPGAPALDLRRPAAAAEPEASPGGQPRHQLDLALTDLAEVLAVYPYRATMPACAHCVTPAELRSLGRAPATIPDAVLDRFAAKALVTWGEVPDLKRLVPELLARTTRGALVTPPAVVGARLRRAGWLDWPAAETPAVRRALRAAWLATLSETPGPGRPPVGRVLGLVASAEDDLSPYLDAWEDRLEAPGDPGARLAAVLHLADLLGPLADGGRRRLGRALPLARRGVVSQLDQWLRLPVVARRLAHAGDALRSTAHHPRVSRGREGMARLRTDR